MSKPKTAHFQVMSQYTNSFISERKILNFMLRYHDEFTVSPIRYDPFQSTCEIRSNRWQTLVLKTVTNQGSPSNYGNHFIFPPQWLTHLSMKGILPYGQCLICTMVLFWNYDVVSFGTQFCFPCTLPPFCLHFPFLILQESGRK